MDANLGCFYRERLQSSQMLDDLGSSFKHAPGLFGDILRQAVETGLKQIERLMSVSSNSFDQVFQVFRSQGFRTKRRVLPGEGERGVKFGSAPSQHCRRFQRHPDDLLSRVVVGGRGSGDID